MTPQLLAQGLVAVLVVVGGLGIVGLVLRALFAPNPALALAERRIAGAGASLGGGAREAGWETEDGVWIQAGWRPRHGKPAEPITNNVAPPPRVDQATGKLILQTDGVILKQKTKAE